MDEQTLTRQLKTLKALHTNGTITRQALKSIRGQILKMEDPEERKDYLEKIRGRKRKNETNRGNKEKPQIANR